MTKLAYTSQSLNYLLQLIKNALLVKIHRQEKAKYIEMMICIQSLFSAFSPNEVPVRIHLSKARPEDY